MIVNHADCLHKRVNDSRSDKVEAAFFQILAYLIGERSVSWHFLERFEAVDYRLVIDIAPDEFVEAAVFLLYFDKGFCIANGGGYLATVADYFLVLHEFFDLFFGVTGDFFYIKIIESFTKSLALFEHRYPRQARLHSLKDEHFEQAAVVVKRHAPFLIMVVDVNLIRAAPSAADKLFFRHNAPPIDFYRIFPSKTV